MVRLALLGAGRIGKIHGRNAALHPQAKLVSVSDPPQPSAEALAAETGARVSSIEEAIAAPDVDAVLICTPTTTHSDFIEKATKAGKAVFCEKPVDLSSERIRTCLAEVARTGKLLM